MRPLWGSCSARILGDGEGVFHSPSVYYSSRLSRAEQETAHLGPANPLQIAVTVMLLFRWSQEPTFFPVPEQRAGALELVLELVAAMYHDLDRVIIAAQVQQLASAREQASDTTLSVALTSQVFRSYPTTEQIDMPDTLPALIPVTRVSDAQSLLSPADTTADTSSTGGSGAAAAAALASHASFASIWDALGLPHAPPLSAAIAPTSTVDALTCILSATPHSQVSKVLREQADALQAHLERRHVVVQRVSIAIGGYRGVFREYLATPRVAVQLKFFRAWYSWARQFKTKRDDLRRRAFKWTRFAIPLDMAFRAWNLWAQQRISERIRREHDVLVARKMTTRLADLSSALFDGEEISEFDWKLRQYAQEQQWPIDMRPLSMTHRTTPALVSGWQMDQQDNSFHGPYLVSVTLLPTPVPFHGNRWMPFVASFCQQVLSTWHGYAIGGKHHQNVRCVWNCRCVTCSVAVMWMFSLVRPQFY
jgi:hypothetical protein